MKFGYEKVDEQKVLHMPTAFREMQRLLIKDRNQRNDLLFSINTNLLPILISIFFRFLICCPLFRSDQTFKSIPD